MNKATIKHRLAATLATIVMVTGTSSCAIFQPRQTVGPTTTCQPSGVLFGSLGRVPRSDTAWTGATSTGFCAVARNIVLTSLHNPNDQAITLALTNTEGQVVSEQFSVPAGGTLLVNLDIAEWQNWTGSIGYSKSPPEFLSFDGTWTT
jgi:hypothetical protein